MHKNKSFLSEHTVEYYLVFELLRILSPCYKTIIPFYYWASREGNIFAKSIEDVSDFKCIAVFPRRPKVRVDRKNIQTDQNEIIVKFNHNLFELTDILSEINVKVIAGVPLVSKLSDLRIPCDCAWFKLDKMKIPKDCELVLQKNLMQNNECSFNSLKGPLDESDIFKVLETSGAFQSWAVFANKLKESVSNWRYSWISHHFSVFGYPYKPFFILLISA